MRISNSFLYSNIQQQLSNNMEKVFDTQRLINSGKKYTVASDEPISSITAMKIKHTLRDNAYYKERQTYVKPFLESSDTQLSTMTEAIRKVKSDMVLAANGTNDNSQLAVLSNKISKELDTIMMAANGKYNNTYLFAGYNNNTPPFSMVGDTVYYNGTSHTTQQEINKGITADVMVPGSKLFETHNIEGVNGVTSATDKLTTFFGASSHNFTIQVGTGTPASFHVDYNQDSLQDVVDRINNANIDAKAYIVSQNGTSYLKIESKIVGAPGEIKLTDEALGIGFLTTMGLADSTGTILGNQSSFANGLVDTIIDIKNALSRGDISGISSASAKIESAYNNILNIQGNIGFETQRVETAQNLVTDEESRLKELQSNTEDLDMITALTDLQNHQTAYEAAMSTSAKVMKLSILNYLS